MDRNLKRKSIKIGNLIVKNETQVNWYNTLDVFDFLYLTENDDRLFKSQYFGDPDYKNCVISILSDSLENDEKTPLL